MIELISRGEHVLLRVHGDLDIEMSPDLRDALGRAIGGHRGVVVDLSGAPRIDSTGLGVLIRARGLARSNGRVICLVAPSRFVLTVLHIMHVDGVFPIFEDCPDAFRWINEEAVPAPAPDGASVG